jgi:hypothetical protein
MKSMCQKSCGTCGCSGGESCPTKVNTQGCQWSNGGQGASQSQSSKTTVFVGPPGNGMGNNGVGPGGNGNNGIGPGAANSNPSNGGPPPGLTRITFG